VTGRNLLVLLGRQEMGQWQGKPSNHNCLQPQVLRLLAPVEIQSRSPVSLHAVNRTLFQAGGGQLLTTLVTPGSRLW
jgi:hypothetical protein